MENRFQPLDGGESPSSVSRHCVRTRLIRRNGTGGIERSGQKAIDLGAVALKAGILHIDTAQIYGTEAETWGAIEKAGLKREDVWVTTKSASLLLFVHSELTGSYS
jgi:diketogulonate reductase-like aldo/keto reductase